MQLGQVFEGRIDVDCKRVFLNGSAITYNWHLHVVEQEEQYRGKGETEMTESNVKNNQLKQIELNDELETTNSMLTQTVRFGKKCIFVVWNFVDPVEKFEISQPCLAEVIFLLNQLPLVNVHADHVARKRISEYQIIRAILFGGRGFIQLSVWRFCCRSVRPNANIIVSVDQTPNETRLAHVQTVSWQIVKLSIMHPASILPTQRGQFFAVQADRLVEHCLVFVEIVRTIFV
ncbi:hypothetical protein T09_7346 [Trichinella sp. T9]|nr:hypothetical protein T09_7346 [Trichinella sp. T9]